MRIFLAVALPDDCASVLYREHTVLRESWTGFRWIMPENYHITLVFLGQQSDETINALRSELPPVIHGFKDFEIELTGVGCFGSALSPRIILERIGKGRDELIRLQSVIRPTIEALIGWEERAFKPHVTLGRSRRGGSSRLPGGVPIPAETSRNTVGPFRAREVVLYRSETKPGGAVYTPIEKWELEEKK